MSLKKVAESAGVSTSTVSRYLNGTLALNDETRARIDSAVKALGYVAKQRGASAPRAGTTVGLILPEFTNPYFAVLADEIVASAEQQSISIALFSALNLPSKETQLVELIQTLNLDGLLYVGSSPHNEALARLIASSFPVVVVDERQTSISDAPTVVHDDYSGAYQAVSYLVGLGHRSVAFISGSSTMSTARERHRAYEDVLHQHGIDPSTQFHGIGSFTEEYGATALAQLLAAGPLPTAVFAASDIIALGMVAAAASLRVQVPGELSIVGYDDIPSSRHLTPGLTTVRAPLAETARAAIDLIVERMAHPGFAAREIIVPVSMRIRGSAGEPRDGG